MVRSSISGISSSKRRRTNSGWLRDRMILTRCPCLRTSRMTALTRAPTWCVSPGICSLRGRSASVLPSATMAEPPSWRVTVPWTRSPLFWLNSSKTALHSASRIFWIITCLALWAAMRPSSAGSTSSSPLRACISPLSRSMVTTTGVSSPYFFCMASWTAASMPEKMISRSIFFSCCIWSTSRIRSEPFITSPLRLKRSSVEPSTP